MFNPQVKINQHQMMVMNSTLNPNSTKPNPSSVFPSLLNNELVSDYSGLQSAQIPHHQNHNYPYYQNY